MNSETTKRLEALVNQPVYTNDFVPALKELRLECLELLAVADDEKDAANLRGQIKAYNLLIKLPEAAKDREKRELIEEKRRKEAEETRNAKTSSRRPAYVSF